MSEKKFRKPPHTHSRFTLSFLPSSSILDSSLGRRSSIYNVAAAVFHLRFGSSLRTLSRRGSCHLLRLRTLLPHCLSSRRSSAGFSSRSNPILFFKHVVIHKLVYRYLLRRDLSVLIDSVLLQVIAVNGIFPGPVVTATTNYNVEVNVFNRLDEPLLLTW